MAIVIETFISCDGCGVTYGADMRHIPGTKHRKNYADYGWKFYGGKDLCPDCLVKVQQKALLTPPRRRRKSK